MRAKATFYEYSVGGIEIIRVVALFDIDDNIKGHIIDAVFSKSVPSHFAKELMEKRVKYAVDCLTPKNSSPDIYTLKKITKNDLKDEEKFQELVHNAEKEYAKTFLKRKE